MTATRIRETPDGVLYRLSEARAYDDLMGISRWASHLLVRHDHHEADGDWTGVFDSDAEGDWYELEIAGAHFGHTDPDAMIEAMGYTVINGEEL